MLIFAHVCALVPFFVLGLYAVDVDAPHGVAESLRVLLERITFLYKSVFLGIVVFRQGHRSVLRVSQATLRHRIVPACAKGLTPKDPHPHQKKADEKAALLKRLDGV